MKGLTYKQERFARAVVETGNITEAYRTTYNTKADKNLSRMALAALRHPMVLQKVRELQKQAELVSSFTINARIEMLKKIADECLALMKYKEAIVAIAEINKMLGSYKQADITGGMSVTINTTAVIPANTREIVVNPEPEQPLLIEVNNDRAEC